MSASLELEVKETIGFLTLAVAPVNALDENALHELNEALEEVEKNGTIGALVIASRIEGIFCTGGNLKYWPRAYPRQPDTVANSGRKVFNRIEHLNKPSVAAIDGHVIGDGLSLALACDIRVATPRTTFRLPELDYGFIPGWGTIGRLVELVGKPLTAELLLFGQEIAADRAQSIQLVNRIAPADELIPLAEDLARRAAGKPPIAMRQAKAALRGDLAGKQSLGEDWELACFKAVWGSMEWRDGIAKLFRN